MTSSEPQRSTSALRWADAAHRAVEARGPAGLSDVLADEFVQESHRGGSIEIRREGLLGTVRMMKEMGLHVAGDPIAVADCSIAAHIKAQLGEPTMDLATSD